MEPFAYRTEVIVKKLLEYLHVMQRRMVDGSQNRPPHLTAAAVAVLMSHQQMGQIAVPQIAVKPVSSRQL